MLQKKCRLLILADEYDQLANKCMFETPVAHNKIALRNANDDPFSSSIRGSFESIKAISALVKYRSVVTGIKPIALADSSGTNIWANISLQSNFGGCFGFS